MENLKNQIGHHVVLRTNEKGDVIELHDVKILSASEYASARDSRDHYIQAVADSAAKAAAQKRLTEEQAKVLQEAEEARIAQEKAYADKYSKQNILIAWLILKIKSFEGKTTADTDRLDQIYADLIAGEKSLEDLSKYCFEFNKVFEMLASKGATK